MMCQICNSQDSFKKKKVPKYGTPVRMIGYFLCLPNLLLLVSGVTGWFMTASATDDKTSAIAGIMGIGIAFPMFLVMLFGAALLQEKKALVCKNCGFKVEAE